MGWIFLIISGLLEASWVTALKLVANANKPWFVVIIAGILLVNIFVFSLALRTIPMGTAYAIWVGIGLLGATSAGIWLFREPVTLARIFFLLLLFVSIVGLKWTTPEKIPIASSGQLSEAD